MHRPEFMVSKALTKPLGEKEARPYVASVVLTGNTNVPEGTVLSFHQQLADLAHLESHVLQLELRRQPRRELGKRSGCEGQHE